MKKAEIQLAFNKNLHQFLSVVDRIPRSESITIEAGTPLLKREGIGVIREMKRHWSGKICADLKVADGALDEVEMARVAGATSVTVIGNAPYETLRLFVDSCRKNGMVSIIDMMNNPLPMRTIWKSGVTPDYVFLHRGRDEENSFGKLIQYKEIAKIKGKWDIKMGVAGGIDQKEMQSAVFNNADLVVINVINAGEKIKGLKIDGDFVKSLDEFLVCVT